VADRLQAELSELIQRELKDPRLRLATVTRVMIDRELEHANIFVSTALDQAGRKPDVLRGLESARGFLRREVGRRVQLRRVPELHFHWDPGPDNVEHVGQILDQLKSAQAPEGTDHEHEADDEI
jgi:ribosome-binding factor A